MTPADQGHAAHALAAQTQQRMEEIRRAQQAIADAQRRASEQQKLRG